MWHCAHGKSPLVTDRNSLTFYENVNFWGLLERITTDDRWRFGICIRDINDLRGVVSGYLQLGLAGT